MIEREALEVAVAHVPFLAPVSLSVAVSGLRGHIVWTSSRTRHGEALAAGEVVFSPVELGALADALEQGRYLPGDLEAFATRKLREPGWRLTELVACHGLVPRAEIRERWRPTWYAGHDALGVHPHDMLYGVTVGRLLAAHHARLERVEIEQSERSAAA